MNVKILLLTTTLSSLSLSLFARTLSDSVGVENQNGRKVILHKLDPKDNYYSIGRRYNVTPSAIIQYNNNASLRVSNIIKVPTEQAFVTSSMPLNNGQQSPYAQQNTTPTSSISDVTQYRVSAGETLYAIARRFNIRVEDIVSLNNLKSNSLTPGQILQIKAAATPATQPVVLSHPLALSPPASSKHDSTAITDNLSSRDSATVERRLPANRYGLSEKNEKGVATWMDDEGMDPNKKLVLHRTAPVGTVIKITNPMTNRTTYAKVVGSFTENEMTKDVIVVMTKSTAESLGALDKRFHVTLSYGTPANE
ncbi:LysM peptidoglycan-binding domain-containing protein [Mucilaginibacter robiniae]|uniref:LysM peptidoglycan-binding domain-containing protein n=1 Tax=Mucilaginibacter robiniae TaxID=2728022 RepID=A0A7L5E390_9SPHI|nr:LysM peptidoglycan-binding domain-containing protein [Mucilaginibacter robiniae]QJD97762.1 LysM peptidoglycan-binding domain-containing protein [Mucilaginibacter robiniae]